MASPFYLFRKYQKSFLVVAGVLAMFIFVLADPLMNWLQSASGGGAGPRSAGTVVATWDGGSINIRQLDSLSQRRYKISEFLSNLVGVAAGIVEQEGGAPLAPTLPDFRLQQDANPRAVQVGCVTTRVLAELASRSGITISDDVINHYLREWGLRRMGDAEMATILGRLGMSDKTLFAGLRELLLGNFYINSYSLATQGVMPEERWQDWKRINERIAVTAALLPAEKFVAAVPEPSEAELRQFHEQHKEKIDGLPEFVMGTQLPSPDPGFREPRRVKLQYLVGSVDDQTQKMLDTVSEEEIVDYYERNKRTQFVKTSTISSAGLFDDAEKTADGEAEDSETGDGKIEDGETGDGKTGDGEPEATAEPVAESPAAEDPPGDDESEDDKSEDGQPGDDPPDDDQPDDDQPDERQPEGDQPKDDQPKDNESSRLPVRSPFRLAALQTEAEATEAEEEASPETAAENRVAAASDEEATAATDSETSPESEQGAPPAATSAVTSVEEEPVVYEPLENVREQIRRSLAKDKAVVELQKIVDSTYASLQSAFNPYGFQVVTARTEEKEIPAPPVLLSDFIAIAKETGLASEETVLLSQVELAETFVGKAFDAQSRREFVVQSMFGDQELYEPYRAIDLDGNSYLVSKTADVPSRVPDFEEVRDSVLAAWKKHEAAKLALDKAVELAKQAEESSESVATVARSAGYETVTTDMFSWLNFGATQAEMQRGPRLGDAPPLTAVGVEFMTKAFELKPDQKIALFNHDQTYAYVLQLDRREQTVAEMRQQFVAEANNWYGGRVMNSSRWGSSQRQLLSQLSEQVGLNLDKLEEFLTPDSQ